MAHCTKQSTTYKREFDLGEKVMVKIGLTLPFTLTDAQIKAIFSKFVDAIDHARFESVPSQVRLFAREPLGAGADGHHEPAR